MSGRQKETKNKDDEQKTVTNVADINATISKILNMNLQNTLKHGN